MQRPLLLGPGHDLTYQIKGHSFLVKKMERALVQANNEMSLLMTSMRSNDKHLTALEAAKPLQDQCYQRNGNNVGITGQAIFDA